MKSEPSMEAHAFNPNILEAEAGSLCEFKTTLDKKVSSRIDRAT